MENDVHDELKDGVGAYSRMYYQHQYDRMAKHEAQRQTVSNFVITLTVVALTLGFTNIETTGSQGQAIGVPGNTNLVTGLLLPVAIVILNLFAIIYIRRSWSTGAIHQARARRVLDLYAPYLRQIDKDEPWPQKGRRWSRSMIEMSIHVVLSILAVLIPVFLYVMARP